MNDTPVNQRPGSASAASAITEDAPVTKASTKPVTREKRKPFGSQIQKLAYEPRVGYHRHWFNDLPGRIESALEAGYTHVLDKEGKKVARVVGVSPTGGPQTGYLMETPQEWFEEDMARQQAVVDENDQAIRTGSVAGTPGKDGSYVKSIKIQTGR